MTARLIASLLTVLATVSPVVADDCPQDSAVYTEKANGYELRFRTPEPWEVAANFSAVLTLKLGDGNSVWGTTWMPNGTSWNQARLYSGCKLPGPIDETTGDPLPGSTPVELDACTVWQGVIYNLAGNDVDYLSFRDDPAAETILLTNLGPVIRYSGLVAGPGDEPHDVFTLTACAEQP